ncbi:unnamed protein product [Candida verbasci]|uniref:Acyl-CoA thioesterase II n=1 Tax=Candida verbasci TaxID=1227364 RepID=A0A9W4XB32_9ASCO|nr:unnamed protein product [Candida verbasci]
MSSKSIVEQFGVDKISDSEYKSKSPLILPFPKARGVYGGNLVGQALLVAIKSCPNTSFKPHSLHSYFITACNNKDLVTYKIENLSNGRSFINKQIRALQNDTLVYIANVSLTNKFKKGFKFESVQQSKEKIKDIPISTVDSHLNIYYKFPKKFVKLDETKYEEDQKVTERKLSFYSKFGKDRDITNDEEGCLKYLAITNLADSGYLTSLTRLLRIEDFPINNHRYLYFLVSMDHTMYFHDDDFDINEWINIQFHSVNFNHDRIVFEGELFNEKGTHIATYVQEGLIKLNQLEEKAKL